MTTIAQPATGPAALAALREFVDAGRLAVLTGAGISTESGIPDYRGPTGALRRRLPMSYQSFVTDPAARHRYWARSYLGWRQIAGARPNAGHRAVTELQRRGLLSGVITQNVDGLHQQAGTNGVVELHGGLDRTVCLSCRARAPRADLDRRLRAVNGPLDALVESAPVNPDGDVELADDQLTGFVMVDCATCGAGPLKPDVVFFGENVPKERVDRCAGIVARSAALLVLGSSLTVLSGLRFVRLAARRGTPVAIVNDGATRGDDLATVRVDGRLGAVLPALIA